MAKTTTGGKGLSLTAKLNVAEAIKAAQLLKKELASIGGVSSSSGKAFDTKPLTAYQQELLKIKQAAAEAATANKTASLATQEALKQERLELIEINKQRAKNALAQQEAAIAAKAPKGATISNSQAEIDAYNNSLNGSKEITSTLNEQNLAQAALANSATASGKAISETDAIEKRAGLTKKQQAFLLAEEKYNQQQATKELKNNVREMNNAKGSLEQRRAAMIRLQTVFDRMSTSERESPAGGRLQGVLGRLNTQVLDLEKSTGRSQRNVGNYLTKAWGGLKLIAGALPGVGLAGLLGFAIEPIVNYIAQLDIFGKKVSEQIKTKQMLSEVNLKGAQNSQSEITDLKLLYKEYQNSSLPLKTRTEAYKELQKMYPDYFGNIKFENVASSKTADAYDRLTNSIIATARARAAADKITENSSRQLDNETKIIDLTVEANNQAEIAKKNLDIIKAGGTGTGAAGYADAAARAEIRQQEALKKINDLKTDSNILSERNVRLEGIVTEQIKKGAKIKGSVGGAPIAAVPKVDTQLNARNALQKKIDDLTKKGTDKKLDADDQELESVRKKYADMQEAAVKFNEKQTKLDNENRKKGLKVNGLRVDGGGLIRAQSDELMAVRDKQDTEKLKVTLDAQKKLYDDYEAYKNVVGEETAKKRYAGLIDIDKTYLESLKAKQDDILGISEKSKGGVDVNTAGNALKLAELKKRIADETYAEGQKYDVLLKQLQSYQTQSKILTANYASDQALIAKNPLNLNAEQLAEQYKVLKQTFDKNISALSVSELTNSIDWSNLFSNLDELAASDIEKLLANIESKFKDLSKTLNPIDLSATRKKLQEARDVLIKDNPFRQVGLAIKTIFSDGADGAKKSASEIHSDWINLARSTEGAFKFVDDAVQSCDILKGAIGDVGTTALSSLTSIARAGIATATAVSAASSAAAATAVATSAAIKVAEKASVILAVISLALVVVQAIASVFKSIFNAGDKRIEKTIQGYQDQLDALDKGFKQLERDVQRSVGESFYTDSLKEIENLNKQQSLLQKQLDAERGKKHADAGKITAYQDQLNEIPNQIQDIQQSITDMLVQTTFKDLSSSLADAFTDAFASGEDSLAKLNEAFNNVIANAVKKGLELKFLQPVVDGFIKDFAAYMNGNGNSAIGFDFNKYKDMLQVAGDSFTAGLEPFKDFFKPADASSSSSAVATSIKSITSDQANALEGITRGIYDQTKILVAQGNLANGLPINTGNSIGVIFNIATANLAHSAAIEANTANTVSELQRVVNELRTISNNTRPTSGRGSGLSA